MSIWNVQAAKFQWSTNETTTDNGPGMSTRDLGTPYLEYDINVNDDLPFIKFRADLVFGRTIESTNI